MANRFSTVPSAAVLRHVRSWLDESYAEGGHAYGENTNPIGDREGIRMQPVERLNERAGYGGRRRTMSVPRLLHKLEHEQKHVTQELADRLLTASCGPHVWYSDPELNAVYGVTAEPDDDARLWALNTWRSWSTKKRGEFLDALESLVEGMRGAGQATPVRRRVATAANGHMTDGGDHYSDVDQLMMRVLPCGPSLSRRHLRRREA